MKVLWVNNIMIPQIAKVIGSQSVPVGGWMVKLADEIASIDGVELTIACPYHDIVEGKTNQFSFMTFCIENAKVHLGNMNGQDVRINEIIRCSEPDIIHIFGTEYLHSYLFSEVAKSLNIRNKVVVSIQGMVSVYAKHFTAYLPHEIVVRKTFRDFYKGNVEYGKKCFEKKGQFEVAVIKNVKHIIGRTDWDKACSFQINPNAHYHFNNEMLRDTFYTSPKWLFNNCNKHTIFLSQATMPLKGLHIALEAVKHIMQFYPDIQVKIAGKNFYEKKFFALSYYEKYILNYIDRNKMRKLVHFTGFLDEDKMVQEYLQANVFVSSSSIENSPNSVCEAMILGVPVVSSMVGGVSNLLTHEVEGYYYQADAAYMLAYYIMRVFEDSANIDIMSKNEISRAEKRHDINYIVSDLFKIYSLISRKEN